LVEGEVWNAKSESGRKINLGAKIKVVNREGMDLIVEEI
jgi:membrane-bound ClpP family serine protease